MFWTRVLSGIVLVIIALATILAGNLVLILTLGIVSLIAIYELSGAMKVRKEEKFNFLEIGAYLGTIVYYCILYFTKDIRLIFMIIMAEFILMMSLYVITFPKYHADQMMSMAFSFIYAPVMLSFVYLTRSLEHGEYLVWMIFISSWVSDTFAYLVGISVGKHKYLPKLSPKKSLEGSIGGIFGAALAGGLYGYFALERIIPDVEITWILVAIGAVGSVISQIGDLAASAIKRNHDIKDYGKLIPGHGGIMDRFDSVIFTAPIIYFLCYYLIF